MADENVILSAERNEMRRGKLSFVVPAYNEEKNIPQLYQRIILLADKLHCDWELIFINDGSRDNTIGVLRHFAALDSRVKVIHLSRNFGHQPALAAGLYAANGDAIISMDCDLQDPPEVIEEMIHKWEKGTDIVYARRLNYRQDNWLKGRLSKLYYYLLDQFSDVKIPRNVGDFRLISREVLTAVKETEGMTPYFRGTVAWTGFGFDYVDYHRPDRTEGESGYTFKKLFQLALSGILNFSFLPLKLAVVFGFLCIIIGLGLIGFMFYEVLFEGAHYEFMKFVVIFIVMMNGVLFILLWLVGEYIGRIYDEVRKRPLYIIKEKLNF